MNPQISGPAVSGSLTFSAIFILVMFVLWIFATYFKFAFMWEAIMQPKRQLKAIHQHYLNTLDYCEKMRPEWLAEYIQARDRGLADEKRVRAEEKTRKQTETRAMEVQETRFFLK